MVKLNNEMLSAYEAPTSKVFEIKVRRPICDSNNGYNSVYHTENYGIDQDEDI